MNIFITGANGFLGQRLSRRLLEEGHELYLLVRNAAKLDSFMQKAGREFAGKIHIAEGDITKEDLGLSHESIAFFAGKIDAIYHAAALLSFDEKDREKTFDVNVGGTENVLRFAGEIGCPKFLYVSTAYTVGKEVEGAEALYSPERRFVNSYEESKCHAEHLVFEYRNVFDIAILRPAIIIGDSRTGEADTTFGLYGLIKGLKLLKKRSLRDRERRTYRLVMEPEVAQNLVPVDYVIEALAAALAAGRNGDILNITNPSPPLQSEVFELVKETLQFPDLEMVPFGQENNLTDAEQAFNNSMSVFHSYFSRTIHFPCGNTERILASAGIPLLKMDKEMLGRIIERAAGEKEKEAIKN